MVQINFARKEINCKIVYYGPGLSGKTTSLEVVHQRTPQGHKGELTSISTDGDRTLFFDFMPLDLGTIAGMKVKFHLYTVPGQVYYNSTRKLVLLGADGMIFVADSTPGRMDDNQQSMDNLRENLAEMGRDLNKIPLVIQYNKRDLPSPIPLAELEAKMNPNKVPTFETSAKTGEGIFQALKAISALVLEDINSSEKKLVGGTGGARRGLAGAAAASASAKPVPAGAEPGIMPEKDSTKVLRKPGPMPVAASASAAAPPTRESAMTAREAAVAAREVAMTARESAPAGGRHAAPVAVAEAPKAATGARTTVKETRDAIAREVRQMQKRDEPVSPSPSPSGTPTGSHSGWKMVVFIVLGVLAGAAAAVAAVKILFHL